MGKKHFLNTKQIILKNAKTSVWKSIHIQGTGIVANAAASADSADSAASGSTIGTIGSIGSIVTIGIIGTSSGSSENTSSLDNTVKITSDGFWCFS